ncbi:hypothetical protein [Streptomyces sp. NPDC048272]|uniref:hypothetical protein n=1 Tax=Streptomyces sp. NPDC048272 TaxID=3154616 RepID=UPI00343844F2
MTQLTWLVWANVDRPTLRDRMSHARHHQPLSQDQIDALEAVSTHEEAAECVT